MRKVRFTAASLLVATLLVGCGPIEEPYVRVNRVQGISDTTVLIGNAAATSGAFSSVGIPFNVGLEARLSVYNAGGGLGGRKVELKHYDDEFDATKGLNFTKKLVDDDKVFALVGHFGTPTVGATVDYIMETGVPMVYAATGINDLYFENKVGNPVMAVQPIYKTEGRVMVARALVEKAQFGEVKKVALLSTSDDAGRSIMEGVDQQIAEMKVPNRHITRIVLDPAAADYNAQATQLKKAAPDVIIAAMNQAPFTKLLGALKDREVEVPVYTSYVSASVAAVPNGFTTAKRKIFANAWVDLYTAEGALGAEKFGADMGAAFLLGDISLDELTIATSAAGVAYAIAGYLAADLFVQGLARLEASKKALDWFNFIDEMESAPFQIPMASKVDFAGGQRIGLDSLLLLQRDEADASGWVLAKSGEAIDSIVARR